MDLQLEYFTRMKEHIKVQIFSMSSICSKTCIEPFQVPLYWMIAILALSISILVISAMWNRNLSLSFKYDVQIVQRRKWDENGNGVLELYVGTTEITLVDSLIGV